jgi:hypothetical protein
VTREDLKVKLDQLVEQLPQGLLQRLVDDAQYFLDWYHSKRQLRRKYRGKSKHRYRRFD